MNMNRRTKTILLAAFIIVFLLVIAFAGIVMQSTKWAPDYSERLLKPDLRHLFGTDFLGRDMFYRTIKGLSTSILIGTLAASVSALIALVVGIIAASFGGVIDKITSYFVDLCMGVPHIVLLLLISFMLGKGLHGIIIAVALTHWPSLSRVIRAEVLAVRKAQFVQTARKMGKTKLQTAFSHIIPHVIPQFIIGLVLLFPHAILHEAALTFLGFGLPIDTPAIGVILSESLKHIAAGNWHLVLFPGLSLVITVMLFDSLGEHLKVLSDPASAQE